MKLIHGCAALVLLASAVNAAAADAKAEYDRRNAERYVATFKSLDLDMDRAVSRTEASGDVNFRPRFEDIDINRDGFVTAVELQRFIELEHGVRMEIAPQ